jgi:two-component system, sensor histidine kinase YesM
MKRNLFKRTIRKIKQRFDDMKYRNKLILLCFLVSLIPLSVMGLFCYKQTIQLLRTRELDSLESSVVSVSNSLDSKVNTYQNLLSYLANSNDLAEFSSYNDANAYDQYEYLTYKMDVFLNTTYLQHPDIAQITIYNADGDMTHGKQLRPISDLENESWYRPERISTQPTWFKKDDGTLCVIQYLCDPYITYIRSYSKNCIAIQLDPDLLFGDLDETADDFHIQVDTPSQTLYSYESDSISNTQNELRQWVTRTDLVDCCGWNVTLERPNQIVFASVRRMGRVIMAILLFCIVIIFSITQLFTSFFEKKISALHYYLQRIKEGHLDYHIHDDSKDELGDLTNNLQAMIDEINRLIREDYQTKIELKETQFKALQAQINPHFLYNCLSLINNKALMNNQPEISQMSQLLSVFYRTTLNKGKAETLLQNEIKNVTSYIDIQRLLHDNSFNVLYQIDPNLPEIEVPNLLLQPLVENSIIHGILPNKTKRGQLFVTITKVMGQIYFTIMDNGIGIPQEKLSTLLTTDSSGYGLKNVHERLILAYGEGSGLTINSIPGQSTMISFKIPMG